MILTPQAQAFSPGTDLWVCPGYQGTSSKWTAAIDWQLNFAFSKYETHQSAEMSLALQKILAQTEFPSESHKQDSEFVMVFSEAHLPVRWVLFYEASGDPKKELFNRILAKAQELKAQSLRLFLPAPWGVDAVLKFNLPDQFNVVVN